MRLTLDKVEAGAFALHARNGFVPWERVTERARHAYRMDAKAVIDAIMLVEAIEDLEESPPQ
jgi:hypothetical protein